MSDLLGLISILLVSLAVIYIALKNPEVSKIILFALILRVLVILIGHYVAILPDSTKDALGFEDLAWSYGKDGFLNALSKFPGMNSYFYSWGIGMLYSLFGRSILMAQSISLLFGVGTVFLGWLLAKKIWGDLTANKVGWVLALFPSLVLYSALPLREVYSGFFLLVAFFGVFNWVSKGNYNSILLAMFGFIGATFFHGPLILGCIIFLIIVGITSLRKLLGNVIFLKLNFQAFLITILCLGVLQLFFLNKIYIPKVGYFQDIHFNWFVSELRARMIGDASYGDWADINSNFEFFYKIPLRVVYFLYSPFPWDVQKLSHLVGVFDGLIYLFFTYLIFCNRKIILKDRFLRIISIILIFYLFAFAIGVSNFGAGIRHRSKFVIEMILLIGPLIPKLVLSNIIKQNKIFKKN